jgi:hypothetical protein
MKKFVLGLLFVVCSVFCSAQSIATGQLFLYIHNDQNIMFCGKDEVSFVKENNVFKLDTTKGDLELTIIAETDTGYRCNDIGGNIYNVTGMINEGTGGVGYMFEPEDAFRMTFFIGTTPTCGK